MEIKCTFDKLFEEFYSCLVRNQQIPENQELNFTGQHESGKTNMDVLYVEFRYCTVTKVPQGLTKIFPNLTSLVIDGSELKKICKNDLVEYKNLKEFKFYRNEIEFLPGNLFEDFKNLEWISFYKNKLKVIEPNILDGLDKLKYVDFSVNPNYGKCYSTIPNSLPNATLDEVKLYLFEKHPKKYELFKDLRTENQLLKESKLKLQTEPEQEKLKSSELTDKLQAGFLNDLKAFTQDETTKDFQIQIDDHEFPVHKFLLAARSPTLAEILKNNPEVENLNLVDISVEIFEIILKFLYTDELTDDEGTNFLHLFAAAGKLKIQELMNFAAVKIIQMITEENSLDILKLSNKYNHDEMRFRAFEAFKRKYPNANLKAEFAVDMDKIDKFIEAIKRKEEIDREIEEMCNN